MNLITDTDTESVDCYALFTIYNIKSVYKRKKFHQLMRKNITIRSQDKMCSVTKVA